MIHSIDKIMRMTLKDKASGDYNWEEIEFCCEAIRNNTLAEVEKMIDKEIISWKGYNDTCSHAFVRFQEKILLLQMLKEKK